MPANDGRHTIPRSLPAQRLDRMCSSLVAATRAVYLEDCIMNKDQVKGVAQKMKGKVNEAIGRVTGRPSRELKGDVDQAAGQVRKDVGDAREAAKDRTTRHQ
jgi:uncharacterized protein YjbJ (UPF0337 family)